MSSVGTMTRTIHVCFDLKSVESPKAEVGLRDDDAVLNLLIGHLLF